MASISECINNYKEKESLIPVISIIILIIISFLEKTWSILLVGFLLTTAIFFVVLPILSLVIRLKYIAIVYRFLLKYIFPLFAGFVILVILSINRNLYWKIEIGLLLLYFYLILKYLENLILLDNFEFDDYIPCSKYLPTKSAPSSKSSKSPTKPSSKSSSIVICANCGKKIEDPKSNICPYCGKDIYKKIKFKKCPVCGLEYDESYSKCPYCGAENK